MNNEYQAFLHLGQDLRGGEEKVEEVRVGVLGFVKGVSGVKGGVVERRETLEGLLRERESIAREKEVGKGLLEVYTRIGELEDALAVAGNASEDDSEDEEDEEEGDDLMGVGRLRRLVRSYLGIRQLASAVGTEHPFLVKQEERMAQIRNTLLLDLGTALKQAKVTRRTNQSAILTLVSLYGDMDSPSAAIAILKASP